MRVNGITPEFDTVPKAAHSRQCEHGRNMTAAPSPSISSSLSSAIVGPLRKMGCCWSRGLECERDNRQEYILRQTTSWNVDGMMADGPREMLGLEIDFCVCSRIRCRPNDSLSSPIDRDHFP